MSKGRRALRGIQLNAQVLRPFGSPASILTHYHLSDDTTPYPGTRYVITVLMIYNICDGFTYRITEKWWQNNDATGNTTVRSTSMCLTPLLLLQLEEFCEEPTISCAPPAIHHAFLHIFNQGFSRVRSNLTGTVESGLLTRPDPRFLWNVVPRSDPIRSARF